MLQRADRAERLRCGVGAGKGDGDEGRHDRLLSCQGSSDGRAKDAPRRVRRQTSAGRLQCPCSRGQCRKCRTPVISIVAPADSVTATTSASFFEPPGCTKALTPTARQASTASGNG